MNREKAEKYLEKKGKKATEQDLENCRIDFQKDKVFINFNNGCLEMTRKEFGGLFK